MALELVLESAVKRYEGDSVKKLSLISKESRSILHPDSEFWLQKLGDKEPKIQSGLKKFLYPESNIRHIYLSKQFEEKFDMIENLYTYTLTKKQKVFWTPSLKKYLFADRTLGLAKYVYHNGYFFIDLDRALIKNQTKLIKYLSSKKIFPSFKQVIKAISENKFEIVDSLFDDGMPLGSFDDVFLMISGGNLDALKYLRSRGLELDPGYNRAVYNFLSRDEKQDKSKLDTLKYLHSENPRGINLRNEFESAIEYGNSDILEYLYSIGAKATPEDADRASTNHKLESLKFLRSKGIEVTKKGIENIKNELEDNKTELENIRKRTEISKNYKDDHFYEETYKNEYDRAKKILDFILNKQTIVKVNLDKHPNEGLEPERWEILIDGEDVTRLDNAIDKDQAQAILDEYKGTVFVPQISDSEDLPTDKRTRKNYYAWISTSKDFIYGFDNHHLNALEPIDWRPELKKVVRMFEESLELNEGYFNSALFNLYPEGGESDGVMKAFNDPWLGPNPVILTLNIGAKRQIKIKKNKGESLTFNLRSGSILYMGKGIQRSWKHSILPAKVGDDKGPLLIITFMRVIEKKASDQYNTRYDKAVKLGLENGVILG